jgi:SWIM/SEC-C metal-binding protein
MARLGSAAMPLMLSVNTQAKAQDLLEYCEDMGWKALVRIAPDEPEDLEDLEYKEDPPTLEYSEPKMGRNEKCHCGSGKKYKKCCLGTDNEYQRDQDFYHE